MLKRVRIENVRSCHSVELDALGEITALVGRNGAGKTNIMRAIDSAAMNAVRQRDKDTITFGDLFDPRYESSSVTFEVNIDGQAYRFEYGTTVRNDRDFGIPDFTLHEKLEKAVGNQWMPVFFRSGEKIHFANHSELQIGANAPSLPAIGSLLPQSDEVLSCTQPVLGLLRSIHYYPLDEPNMPSEHFAAIRHADYASWLVENQRSPDPSTSVAMRVLFLSQEEPELFEELKELVGPHGLGIINDIDVQSVALRAATKPSAKGGSDANRFYFIRFLPSHGGDSWHLYGELSFGTRRLLRILASLLVDKSSVMLIEQPEDGIHPALLHKLIPLLKSYSDTAQFIIASHSPAVFNRLSPGEIRLVQIENGGSGVRALTEEEIEGAERFISEDGPLSEFLEVVQGEG